MHLCIIQTRYRVGALYVIASILVIITCAGYMWDYILVVCELMCWSYVNSCAGHMWTHVLVICELIC